MMIPTRSPSRIDMFQPSNSSQRTTDFGPVSAAVTDFMSPIPLADGTMDPSDAQLTPK